MPKVCLITRDLTTHNKVWTQVLRHLGIDYTICVASSGGVGATIQTPQGGLAANSADLRNYFRQFDAVICCDHARTLSETAVINYSVYWLGWNAPEDPAFLFFNPHFSTAITESAYNSNFPSDFPIVRPNASDLAGTLYAADGGSPSVGTPLFAGGTEARDAMRAVSCREYPCACDDRLQRARGKRVLECCPVLLETEPCAAQHSGEHELHASRRTER
jgi:hypothetical protein